VVEAADGHQALELLRADASIDVVFTDITLPGQPDGFSLAQWVRSRSASMPIILTSGGHNAARAAEQCKGEPFFEKPYDIGELASRIRGMLAGEGAD
jgi:DNA-binding NtrC family response regulator